MYGKISALLKIPNTNCQSYYYHKYFFGCFHYLAIHLETTNQDENTGEREGKFLGNTKTYWLYRLETKV